MDAAVLLKGLIIGFAMAVPIGPLGVLCIRKTLVEGRARGIVLGIGAATVDALYSGIAAFGLTFVQDTIESHAFWVRLIGGLLLLLLGIRTIRVRRADPLKVFDSHGVLGVYVSSCLIALTNPTTIFAFLAVFAAFGLAHDRGSVEACLLMLGVFTGSALWFVTLGSIATVFHGSVTAGGMRWVNKIAGVLIIVSGILLFAGGI